MTGASPAAASAEVISLADECASIRGDSCSDLLEKSGKRRSHAPTTMTRMALIQARTSLRYTTRAS